MRDADVLAQRAKARECTHVRTTLRQPIDSQGLNIKWETTCRDCNSILQGWGTVYGDVSEWVVVSFEPSH